MKDMPMKMKPKRGAILHGNKAMTKKHEREHGK